jgi:hypothetical protein
MMPTKKDSEYVVYNTLQNKTAIVDKELKEIIMRKT